MLAQIDGIAAAGVARWDGSTWEEVGGGCPAYWPTLAVYDDGSGPALWALDAEGDELAKWDGVSWTSFALQPGDASLAWRLTPAEIGGQHALYWTDWINGSSRLWRWQDGAGQPVAEVGPGAINDLEVNTDIDLGEGIFAAGYFTQAGGDLAVGAARWDGTVWNVMGNENAGNGTPNARAVRSVGSEAGMSRVVVEAFELGDLGPGTRLFAGGTVLPDDATGNSIIAWDGTDWTVVGGHMDGSAAAFAFGALDGGEPTLFVGGRFDTIDGDPFYSVAALTDAGWAPLGQGLQSSFGSTFVGALKLHDDGAGVALYAGGSFRRLDPELEDSVVRWDGKTWSRVGEAFGFAPTVHSLLSTDLGDGPRLYAAGSFSGANGELDNVAVWDGSAWLPLGAGLPFDVGSLTRLDTPDGPRLAATAEYSADEVVERVYVWDGVEWSPFGALSVGRVRDLAQAEHEFGAVYMCGLFSEIDGVPSEGFARFGCEDCDADFNNDGGVDTRDFIAFLNAWAAGDETADTNGDGVVNSRDVTAFLNLWNAGC